MFAYKCLNTGLKSNFTRHRLRNGDSIKWVGCFHYTTLLYPENACFFTLHDMKTKFIGHIDNEHFNFELKVRYHGNSGMLMPGSQFVF